MEKNELLNKLVDLKQKALTAVNQKTFTAQMPGPWDSETNVRVLHKQYAEEIINNFFVGVRDILNESTPAVIDAGQVERLKGRIEFYERHLTILKLQRPTLDAVYYNEEVEAINYLLFKLKKLSADYKNKTEV